MCLSVRLGLTVFVATLCDPPPNFLTVYSLDVVFFFYLGVVDFPVLEVSVLPHTLELSFKHPYYVHKDESLNDEFWYDISFNQVRSVFLKTFLKLSDTGAMSDSI